MRKNSIHLRYVAALLTLVIASASARAQSNENPATAAARASLERIQALRKERPGDAVLVFFQAMTHVSLGEREAAFDLLRSLKGRKLGLIPSRGLGFDAVWDDPEFRKLCQELAEDDPKTPDSPVAFRLKDPKLIPEGIAYSPAGERFLIGSIAQRKIIMTDAKGNAQDFSKPSDKLDTVLGLAVDAERGHLYAVSTNGFLEEAKKERRNAVVRYHLKDNVYLDRFDAPDAMQLNDIAIAPDGTLYVTDSASATLFRKKPDEKTLTRFGAAGALRGGNGIALGKDGMLYVASSTGILRIDTGTGEPARLPQPDTAMTGGIDGLYWHDGDLIGVQNVTNPGRVIRIALAEKGTRIAGVTVLQSHHHPDFVEPTTGTLANGALHVLGNTYVRHYQPDGTLKDEGALKGTAIIAVPLKR